MNQLQRLLAIIGVLCFASALRARPQTVSANPQVNVSSMVEVGRVVPSDEMHPSGALVPGNQTAINADRRNAANTEAMRGSARAGRIQGGPSRLCFEPGIGWQLVSTPATVSTEMLSAPGLHMVSTLNGRETKTSATDYGLQSAYARSAGATKAEPDECPAILANPTTSGALGDSIVGNPFQTIPSVPTSSGTFQRHFVGLGSAPIGYIPASASSRSSVPAAGQIAGLKTKAYLSPIKLRRMMRNAHDLQTRIELRELQDRPTKGSHVATGIAKKHKTMTDQLTNEPGDNGYFPSGLAGHGHLIDSARRLSSHTYP